MLKIPTSELDKLFAAISGEMPLFLPIEETGAVEFKPWKPGAAVRLERLHTNRSPKDFFFPDTENIAAFQNRKKELSIEDMRNPGEPFAVFGVRACDAASFDILDRVFLGDPQFVDTFYQNRRENGVVITSACFAPEETCFCTAFDIDAVNPAGDVATWLVGDTLYWKALTRKGEVLTEKIKPLLTISDDDSALETTKQAAQAIFEKLPFADLNLAAFSHANLMETFDAPQWKTLHYACLGCGTCTFTCPTCHCYDIQDYNTGKKIVRSRCWDSCMYSDFTLMAHGNPRTSQLQRFRQRFMHKLVYFPENNDGVFACTGCGRCVQKCPVSLNIVKVIRVLEGGGAGV